MSICLYPCLFSGGSAYFFTLDEADAEDEDADEDADDAPRLLSLPGLLLLLLFTLTILALFLSLESGLSALALGLGPSVLSTGRFFGLSGLERTGTGLGAAVGGLGTLCFAARAARGWSSSSSSLRIGLDLFAHRPRVPCGAQPVGPHLSVMTCRFMDAMGPSGGAERVRLAAGQAARVEGAIQLCRRLRHLCRPGIQNYTAIAH